MFLKHDVTHENMMFLKHNVLEESCFGNIMMFRNIMFSKHHVFKILCFQHLIGNQDFSDVKGKRIFQRQYM